MPEKDGIGLDEGWLLIQSAARETSRFNLSVALRAGPNLVGCLNTKSRDTYWPHLLVHKGSRSRLAATAVQQCPDGGTLSYSVAMRCRRHCFEGPTMAVVVSASYTSARATILQLSQQIDRL